MVLFGGTLVSESMLVKYFYKNQKDCGSIDCDKKMVVIYEIKSFAALRGLRDEHRVGYG